MEIYQDLCAGEYVENQNAEVSVDLTPVNCDDLRSTPSEKITSSSLHSLHVVQEMLL